MSSTTSSDCESCDCSQCTYSFENNHNDYGKLLLNSRHIPMYATMAHPLVYYAEIKQPLNKRQTFDQPRKENPFKKAFKWYTQERNVCNKCDAAPERSGFANWLDNKYVEYLRESGQQTKAPTAHEPRAPKTSTATRCHCPGTTKKGRMKSPWNKSKRSSNDSGDVAEKCHNASCQFLLKPKELTRAASEPSYHTPTSGGKSSSTVASSNMPCNPKCSGRSHSLSDVAREKGTKHSDTVPHAAQVCPNCQEQAPTKLATTTRVYPQEQSPSKGQDETNQAGPCCKCLQKKVPEIEQVPTTQQYPTNQPKPLPEEVPSEVKLPTNLAGPCCKCLQEKVPEIEQVPSKPQYPTNQPKPLQEEVPKIVRVPSKQQDPTNQPKPVQEEVPKVPSKAQCPANQLELCCKCNLEKVPKVVQVPSQSRAVEESSQCPEEKVVPVHEETQYAPEPARSTQNLGPCCCKTCNRPIPPPSPPLPPPQMLCIPVKVQSNKIPSRDMCLAIVAPVLTDAPKKQKAKQLCVSCQSSESKSKVDLSACCKVTPARPNYCHEVNQVFGPIPIRRQSCSTVGIQDETGECCTVNEAVVKKCTRCVTCASNGASQTSDHSISFEKPPRGCCQHPLFFKIIGDK